MPLPTEARGGDVPILGVGVCCRPPPKGAQKSQKSLINHYSCRKTRQGLEFFWCKIIPSYSAVSESISASNGRGLECTKTRNALGLGITVSK